LSLPLCGSVRLEFQIELHVQDLEFLKGVQSFFNGIGSITCNEKAARYYVSSLNDILNYIFPHFYTYPLHTQKGADFLLFKRAMFFFVKKEHLIIKTGNHLNVQGRVR
jgi:hypothetical protein